MTHPGPLPGELYVYYRPQKPVAAMIFIVGVNESTVWYYWLSGVNYNGICQEYIGLCRNQWPTNIPGWERL